MCNIELLQGDCLERMTGIPDGSIDMILCDLPYGTTACKWDTVIPFGPLWEQYSRIIKDNGAIVLFATQPFTSRLVCSNLEMFKYCWTWDKCKVGGFTLAKNRPLKLFEDVCVFSKGSVGSCGKNTMTYNPQGLIEINKTNRSSSSVRETGYARPSSKKFYQKKYTNYPTQLLKFPHDKHRLHPTPKPVALLEYLVKTYTKPGENVLDGCMGSGSSGVACINTGRNFIGIELDEHYFDVAKERIEEARGRACGG